MFNNSGHYLPWPKVADAVIEAEASILKKGLQAQSPDFLRLAEYGAMFQEE